MGSTASGRKATAVSIVVAGVSDAPNFASTLMNTALQVGIAVGAALGGAVIAAGWGYGQLPLVACTFSVLALGLSLLMIAHGRRRRAAID
jgi:DHA1 family inner membrane transport protein